MGAPTFREEIENQLEFWQDILSLRDWQIEVRISRQWNMDDHLTLAQCTPFLGRKDAIIKVLDPRDLDGLRDRFLNSEERDYDVSIVHELLHLHFAPFQTEDGSHLDLAEEQAVNAISRGLVRLYRRPQPRKMEIQQTLPGMSEQDDIPVPVPLGEQLAPPREPMGLYF